MANIYERTPAEKLRYEYLCIRYTSFLFKSILVDIRLLFRRVKIAGNTANVCLLYEILNVLI